MGTLSASELYPSSQKQSSGISCFQMALGPGQESLGLQPEAFSYLPLAQGESWVLLTQGTSGCREQASQEAKGNTALGALPRNRGRRVPCGPSLRALTLPRGDWLGRPGPGLLRSRWAYGGP